MLTISLERAGHTDAVKVMKNNMETEQEEQEEVEERPEEAMTGDATLVDSTSGDLSLDLQTPADGSQPSVAGKSPVKAKLDHVDSTSTSPVKRDFALLAIPMQETADVADTEEGGHNKEEDSIFGDVEDGKEEKDKSKADVEMEKEESETKVASPSTAPKDRKNVDLGYLYTVSAQPTICGIMLIEQWWTIFEDTQRLVKSNQLRPRSLRPTTTVPSTAMPPTSALAAKIAVSNPADAVRASSIDPLRQGANAMTDEEARPPITATLRQADEMRRMQQATIEAHQLDERRRSLAMQNAGTAPVQAQAQHLAHAQQQMMVSGSVRRYEFGLTLQHRAPVIMANGQPITAEQYQQIHQQQHQLQQQSLLAQGYPAHMLPRYDPASAQAALHAQTVAQHAQAQQQVAIQQQQQQQAHAQAQAQAQAQANGSFRSETPRHMSLNLSGGMESGSPSTESGGSMKRGIGESPVDAPTKRARVGGKRPSKLFWSLYVVPS